MRRTLFRCEAVFGQVQGVLRGYRVVAHLVHLALQLVGLGLLREGRR
jgi:hypothetical protein